MIIEKRKDDKVIHKLDVKSIITDDPIATKGFIVGTPAIIVSLYSSIAGLFIT